jgi:hypothetical protein
VKLEGTDSNRSLVQILSVTHAGSISALENEMVGINNIMKC